MFNQGCLSVFLRQELYNELVFLIVEVTLLLSLFQTNLFLFPFKLLNLVASDIYFLSESVVWETLERYLSLRLSADVGTVWCLGCWGYLWLLEMLLFSEGSSLPREAARTPVQEHLGWKAMWGGSWNLSPPPHW